MRHILDLHRGYRVGRRSGRAAAGLELLEPRQLLSSVAAGAHESFYNLTGSFLPTSLPPEMAGQPMQGSLSLAVKNAGTLALPPSQQVTIKFIAHGTSSDVMLGTSKPQNVSKLKAGDSKTFTFDVSKAAAVPAGDYTIEALITPTPALAESSTDDNLVTTTAAHKTIALHVIKPDITGTLGVSTLPGAILTGSQKPVDGDLTVLVKNDGKIALPGHEQITLQIKAHNTTTGKDYVLNSNPKQKFDVGGLGVGQSIAITPNLHFTGKSFPAGTYQLEALITPVQALPETDPSNNLVTLNAAGQTVTLTSSATAVADLTGVFASSTVKSTNIATTGKLTITLTNTGTAPIVDTQPVSFTIIAHPTGSTVGTDVTLATDAQHFAVKNLKVGQSATFTVNVNDPNTLPGGTYDLLANITASGLAGPTSSTIVSVTKNGAPVVLNSNNTPLVVVALGTPLDLGNVTLQPGTPIAVNQAWTSGMDISTSRLIVEATNPATASNLANQVIYAQSHSGTYSSNTLPASFSMAVVDNATLTGGTLNLVSAASGSGTSILVSSTLLGDANADGHVDLTDLSTVLNNFGTTTLTWTTGNFDGTPTIDLTHLADFLNEFGLSNPGSSGTSTTSGSSPTGDNTTPAT